MMKNDFLIIEIYHPKVQECHRKKAKKPSHSLIREEELPGGQFL